MKSSVYPCICSFIQSAMLHFNTLMTTYIYSRHTDLSYWKIMLKLVKEQKNRSVSREISPEFVAKITVIICSVVNSCVCVVRAWQRRARTFRAWWEALTCA